MSDSSHLSVQDLSKDFSTAAGSLSVLRGANLNMTRGESLAITGPSGSGKSTLLYIAGTLDEPTSGTVLLDGSNPFEKDTAELATYRNQNVGFIFQDHQLLPQCTVLENVLIPLLARDEGVTKDDEERAKSLLERVGLAERINHRPAQLSGGERQRASVCRSLINEPLLLLADEPTGNLDRETANSVGSLLLELGKEQNTMLICVTHSGELAERFPRHMRLRDGKLEE